MRRADRQITDPGEILDILNRTMILHLGLLDEHYPYVVPLHYGYEYRDDTYIFYMHCAHEGRKLDLIRRNPYACIEIDNDAETVGKDTACSYGSFYSSVMAEGKAEIVEDTEEKIHGLQLLMVHQTGREFEITEQMTKSVELIRFTVENMTAKARKKS